MPKTLPPESGISPEEKVFYVLLTIFGALFPTGLYFLVVDHLWWGCFYTVVGLGGLLVLIKDRLRPIVVRLPTRKLLMLIASVSVAVLTVQVVIMIFTLRSDLDTYVMPRTITERQANDLHKYLSKYEPSTLHIKVVQNDPEAVEYAGYLFKSLVDAGWDINPPDHKFEFLEMPSTQAKPDPGDPRYKGDLNAYLAARDVWLHWEILREVTEKWMYPTNGLTLHVERVGQQGLSGDPKHPAPDTSLAKALQYANIEFGGSDSANQPTYSITLVVGHRPKANYKQSRLMPLYRRISQPIERWLTQ
jgi:hypothetical protein